MSRLEEIREQLRENLSREFMSRYSPSDICVAKVEWLLERVSELEGQMDKAREQVYSDGRTIKRLYEANKELEAENERLRENNRAFAIAEKEMTAQIHRLRRECVRWQEMAHSLIPDE